MNLSVYIARRYLLSRKSVGAINLISGISVCGVALATVALVCTLSVFNGFRELVADLFTAFDPELKVTAARGTVMDTDDPRVGQACALPGIEVATFSVEGQAMLRYKGRQEVVTLKGVVADEFRHLTRIDSILYGRGEFVLDDGVASYGVPGMLLVSALGTGMQPMDPVEVLVPKRGASINVANPSTGFRRDRIFFPGVAFGVGQQKYDAAYVLVSADFARSLMGYGGNEATALELKLAPGADADDVKSRLGRVLGEDFRVENRYEQQADVFRIMEIEKLISYVFLTFILMVACFNIVGSLGMLIIDKKEDIRTLRNLGADKRTVAGIFVAEGCMVSLIGAVAGVVAGVVLCFVQDRYGLIALGAQGGFVVDAYPVSVEAGDVLLVFLTVAVCGTLSAWVAVREGDRISE